MSERKKDDELAPVLSETLAAGGFRIEVDPDELAVTADQSAWTAKSSTQKAVAILGFALGSFIVFQFVADMIRNSGRWFLAFAAYFAAIAVWAWRFGKHDIRCTRDSFVVLHRVRWMPPRERAFPRTAVGKIAYGEVYLSRSGNSGGLVFSAAEKRVKCLGGLKPVEANRILDELQRLGYEIVKDVGLPMMVEMEEARRRSLIGWPGK